MLEQAKIRGVIAIGRRAGSLDPPAVRPSFLALPPGRRPRNAGCQPASLAQLTQALPIPAKRNRIRTAFLQKILIDTIPKLESRLTHSKQTTEFISNRYKLKAGTFAEQKRVERIKNLSSRETHK